MVSCFTDRDGEQESAVVGGEQGAGAEGLPGSFRGANSAHIRQSRPDSGLGSQVKGFTVFPLGFAWSLPSEEGKT